jgi:hypothetical protein
VHHHFAVSHKVPSSQNTFAERILIAQPKGKKKALKKHFSFRKLMRNRRTQMVFSNNL